MTIRFRSIRENDIAFLQTLYRSTRWDELEPVSWSTEQKEKFLDWQFEAQHSHYQKYFPDAAFDIVLYKSKPIGRLYLDRRPDEIRIVDIALLPDYRNRGIGSRILKQILADAAKSNLLVRIHVEHNNPAMSLYERLGFRKIDEEGVYWLMQWSPSSSPNTEED